MSSFEEPTSDYNKHIAKLTRISIKGRHKQEGYNLSPSEANNELVDSLYSQGDSSSTNKYGNTSNVRSHKKSKRHRKERDEVYKRKRHRKEPSEFKDNDQVFTHKAGTYYKEQTCMEDFPSDNRCPISDDKDSNYKPHRYKNETSKDLVELLSSKHSLESEDDSYNFKRSRSHKESRKYRETEKWGSILQGKKTIFVKGITNTDSRNDDGSENSREGWNKDEKINEEEGSEEILTTLERVTDNEMEVNYAEDVENKSPLSEGEIKSDESVHLDQHVIYKSSAENTPTLDDKLNSPIIINPQAPEHNENLDAYQLDTDDYMEQQVDEVRINFDLPPYYPAIQGCRSVNEFQILNRVNEGTYGIVYRARDKHCQEIVALKRLKMENEKEGFPITSLREINTLLKGQHLNIVTVREIVMGTNMENIFIVMDFVDHDLKSFIEIMRQKKQSFTAAEVKCLLKQLLCAVAYLHDNWILHRDLKTSNLLLSQNGILKVGDFGLAREYGSPLKAYTPVVVTLWYRAPELLLCTKQYSTPIDVWSVGCIFGELVHMIPIFQGKSEIDQVFKVFKVLGTPNEATWPGFNKLPAVQKIKFNQYPMSNLRSRFHMLTVRGQALLQQFLTYDPTQRITAQDALEHSYFNESPLPIEPSMLPTWPTRGEMRSQQTTNMVSKQLADKGGEDNVGFHINPSVMENRKLPTGGGFNLKF